MLDSLESMNLQKFWEPQIVCPVGCRGCARVQFVETPWSARGVRVEFLGGFCGVRPTPKPHPQTLNPRGSPPPDVTVRIYDLNRKNKKQDKRSSALVLLTFLTFLLLLLLLSLRPPRPRVLCVGCVPRHPAHSRLHHMQKTASSLLSFVIDTQ